MTPNPLTNILPAVWRQRLYALYALACVVVGALAVAGVADSTARDVLVYVGAALGLTAASNTDPSKASPAGMSVGTVVVNTTGDAKPTS